MLTFKKTSMNYSTIKKTAMLSLVAALAFTATSQAQDSTSTMAASSSAKVFGGRAQYRTWSIGVNAGILQPVVLTGGSSDFANWQPALGYGFTIRKQFGHVFGLELAGLRGNLKGSNEKAENVNESLAGRPKTFETNIGYQGTLMGYFNLGTINFLKRENSMNFIFKAGYGMVGYNPTLDGAAHVAKYGESGSNEHINEQIFPIGLAMKFKVSERVNFDLGYNQYFLDGDNLDGVYAKGGSSKDKYSYGYAGLEFSLGSTAKPNIDFVNPIAVMYDELKDPTLRQEVEALKGRVTTVETTVNDLLKDTDGDGVADKLDKCPNTEAGVKVDGSGCPLDTDQDGIVDSKDSCPTEKGTAELNGCPAMGTATMTGYDAIQFEFNSSVLRTSSYPALDKLSADLKAGTTKRVQLDGHASAEGTDEYNMQLSKDRANSVKTYLVNSGVAASKIATKGYGESRPIASNTTEEGRSKNRRVEFRKQ